MLWVQFSHGVNGGEYVHLSPTRRGGGGCGIPVLERSRNRFDPHEPRQEIPGFSGNFQPDGGRLGSRGTVLFPDFQPLAMIAAGVFEICSAQAAKDQQERRHVVRCAH